MMDKKAMAFYHPDGLVPAWHFAMRFAGKEGIIATLPMIVRSRIIHSSDSYEWNTWFTTSSAEYVGVSRGGNKIIIVAHGIGPMETLDGILKAYSWQFKDKTRSRNGGRITEKEFWDLESGIYGNVDVADFDTYDHQYQFDAVKSYRRCINDPLVKARFGYHWEIYLKELDEIARKWHEEEAARIEKEISDLADAKSESLRRRHYEHVIAASSNPYILVTRDAANCSYTHTKIEKGYALAHLLTTGQLIQLNHDGHESLVSEVDCFEWTNGAKFVGLTANSNAFSDIAEGPDAHQLLEKNWENLFIPTKTKRLGMRRLIKLGSERFTEYPKVGAAMDTGEPEYYVTAAYGLGKPVTFITTIGGYHGFFKYAMNEVVSIAPPGANAYEFVSKPTIVNPNYHSRKLQFYRVEVDTSRRLIKAEDLARDYDKMMSLI